MAEPSSGPLPAPVAEDETAETHHGSDEPLEAALYVVGTPLGNRADLSPRARSVLLRVPVIACEDTRRFRNLLAPGRAGAELVAYHEHNEQVRADQLAARIAGGTPVALVSDAGMPGIADPGFRLVRACRREGLPVISVPGPVAFTSALAVSGLPSDQVYFLGFLPPKSAARRRLFEGLREHPATLACYESTHRIEKALADVSVTLGEERTICVARELTKRFETVISGPVDEVRLKLAAGSLKGEFIILIAKEGYAL